MADERRFEADDGRKDIDGEEKEEPEGSVPPPRTGEEARPDGADTVDPETFEFDEGHLNLQDVDVDVDSMPALEPTPLLREEAGAVGGEEGGRRPKRISGDFVADLEANGYLVLPKGRDREENMRQVAERWRDGARLPQRVVEALMAGMEEKAPPADRAEVRRRKADQRLRTQVRQMWRTLGPFGVRGLEDLAMAQREEGAYPALQMSRASSSLSLASISTVSTMASTMASEHVYVGHNARRRSKAKERVAEAMGRKNLELRWKAAELRGKEEEIERLRKELREVRWRRETAEKMHEEKAKLRKAKAKSDEKMRKMEEERRQERQGWHFSTKFEKSQ